MNRTGRNRRRTGRRVIGAVGAVVLATALVACGDSDSGGGEALKVGLIPGISGPYGPWADPAINSAEIAVDEINEAGGVNGSDVELVVEDSKSTAEGGVAAFRKASEVDQVTAVGGIDSDPASAIYDSATEQQIPVMCAICGTSKLDTLGGEYLFRLTASDSDGGVAAAQFARDSGIDSVSLLVEKVEGPESTANVFKESFEQKVGGQVLEDVRFDSGERNFAPLVQQAFEGDPEAVYLATSFESAIPIFNEWKSRGYGGQFFVSPDVVVPETASDDLTGVATGAVAAYDVSTAPYQSFAKRYEEKTGDKPSAALGEPNQYDQIILLALASAAAGESTGSGISENMTEIAGAPGTKCSSYEECLKLIDEGEDIDYEGASGPLDFNEFGNLDAPTIVPVTPRNGEWLPDGDPISIDPSLRP